MAARVVPSILRSLIAVLATSAVLVGPFVVLQWLNRRAFREEFPIVLFGFMTLNALLIVLAFTPGVQRVRSEGSLGALQPGHWAGLLLSALLAVVYVNVVIDQLPCFLGVPNCD